MKKHNIIIILLCLISCQKEKAFHTKKALKSCIEKKGNNYGIMLFGDSMLNFPSSHIMSFLSKSTNTYQGLGNSNYPITGNLVNNKGCFLNNKDGSILLNVNQQQKILGQPEWPGRLGYMNGQNQNISFVTNGVFPIGAVTKIFILTDTIKTGTYDIQKSIDNGTTWKTIVFNKTTFNSIKGMKVHTFDDRKKSIRIGYRILWKSGQIMCLDPFFLKSDNNNIYHITVGSGGADFKLQTLIPKERIRFLIKEANIKMVTSSHRYEVKDILEFKIHQDLMDSWWKNQEIDVLYFGQPPQTNDNIVADQLKRDINNEILSKAKEKGYLYFDMYKEMGGIKKLNESGLVKDPVHLSLEAYEAIEPNLIKYLNF